MHYVLLAVSFAMILAGSVVFTNAVEWAGIRLGLGAGAVGSILAAIATALPESVIPILAIVKGGSADEVAIGSILGAPFLLATLAMLVLGVSIHVFANRREEGSRLQIHGPTTARDLVIVICFLLISGLLGVFGNHTARVVAAIVFACCYVVYAWRTISAGGEAGEEPETLYFDPFHRARPASTLIAVQLVAGLGGIVVGAELFVRQVEHITATVGVSALILALIIAPLATELPEQANGVLWSRRDKDALALGNITGAMVFQALIPMEFGLAFTPWDLTTRSLVIIGCAVVGCMLALLAVLTQRRFTAPLMVCWGVLYVGGVVFVAVG